MTFGIQNSKIEKTAIIIAGASGDLAKRKIIPALNILFNTGKISNCCTIIGTGRSDFSDEEFRNHFELSDKFTDLLFYHKGVKGIKKYITEKGDFKKIVIFLALPPKVYAQSVKEYAKEGFGDETNIVIEKPFGYDFNSAQKLNKDITQDFKESQIFRIDHYLAKEAVQNILVFRFANTVFEPVWNSHYIESIQINAFEEIGIEDRGAYFDNAGIIRDMIQNHLIQLLCLMTMEAPVSLDPKDIKSRKIDILRVMELVKSCRFQYEGYHDENGVAQNSTTETFAEQKLLINNSRWTGMPIYIRAGKALNRKGTEIGIKFKPIPKLLFNEQGHIEANKIIFKIQPAEGIVIDMSSKMPGSDFRLTNTNMNFCYRDSFEQNIPEAYQKLLLDALRGDHTLFVSAEETEIQWKIFQDFLDKGDITKYPKGIPPKPCYGEAWLDFERYISVCS